MKNRIVNSEFNRKIEELVKQEIGLTEATPLNSLKIDIANGKFTTIQLEIMTKNACIRE